MDLVHTTALRFDCVIGETAECFGHGILDGSPIPPHPGPLPWGEGELPATATAKVARSLEGGRQFSLSPRERAGVRGKSAYERTIASRIRG
jgi:hypothetical protein